MALVRKHKSVPARVKNDATRQSPDPVTRHPEMTSRKTNLLGDVLKFQILCAIEISIVSSKRSSVENVPLKP